MAGGEDKKKVQAPRIGLDQDSSLLNYPDDSYKYALNAQLEANKGIAGWLQTEESNIPCLQDIILTFCIDADCAGANSVYLYQYNLIGSKVLPDESIILFLTMDVSINGYGSIIARVDKYCNFNLILAADCLNFSSEHPIIDCEYRELADCTKPIYFTDNYNPPRKVDISQTYNPLVGGNYQQYSGSTGDCSEFNLFKYYTEPCVTITDVNDTGGTLASGVYYLAVEYANISGFGLFPPQSVTNPIPIIHDNWKGAIDNSTHIDINSNAQGCVANTPTSKSIDISFSNFNSTDFQYFNLVVVKQIGGVKTAFTVITLPTTTTSYTYTGFENELPRSLDSVVAEGLYYLTAKTLCNSNQRLNLANLTGRPNPNFQQYANQIAIKWVAKEYYASNPGEDHFSPLKAANEKTFMGDEVYALGIRLIWIDGTKTCVYHIPGREKDYGWDGMAFTNIQETGTEVSAGGTYGVENDQYGNNLTDNGSGFIYWDSGTQLNGNSLSTEDCSSGDDLKCINQESGIERWQVYNTATMDPGVWNPNSGYGSSCLTTGQMAYWESCLSYPDILDCDGNRLYPNGKIRHHKFPDSSILHIHDGYRGFGEKTFYERPNLRNFGINAYNVNIPSTDEYKDIVGWEIVVADRTGNEGILAKGIMFNNWVITGGTGFCQYQAPVFNDTRSCRAVGGIFGNWYSLDSSGDEDVFNCSNNDCFYITVYNPSPTDSVDFHYINCQNTPQIVSIAPLETKDICYTTYTPNPDLTITELGICCMGGVQDGGVLYNWTDNESRTATAWLFGFWSPETSYKKPALSTSILTTYTEEVGKAVFTANGHGGPIPYDYASGEGTYNMFNRLTTYSDRNRKINNCVYVNNNAFEGTLGSAYRIKNLQRESYVNIQIGSINSNKTDAECGWITPITEPCDNTQSSNDLKPGDHDKIYDCTGYYSALKTGNLSLYNTIESIKYLSNGKCYFDKSLHTSDASINSGGSSCDTAVWEGDCFVAPHIFHKRHCWGSYAEFPSDICDASQDTDTPNIFYAVPQVWIETRINTYYRTDLTDFTAQYSIPYLNNGTFAWIDWLTQQIAITEDNYYAYNFDYSAQNDIKSVKACSNYDLTLCCSSSYKTRDIYSNQGNNEQGFDAWEQFGPSSYYDYDKSDIEVTDIFSKYDSLYVRTIINLWRHPVNPQEIETTSGTAILNPSAFLSTIPIKLGDTEVGYGGSENQACFNNTPFGIYYASTTDRRIYQFTDKLNDISSIKMKAFFKENLNLYLRDSIDKAYGIGTYKLFDAPTSLNGTGLISVWDNKYNRYIFTKIDYLPLKPFTALPEHYSVQGSKNYDCDLISGLYYTTDVLGDFDVEPRSYFYAIDDSDPEAIPKVYSVNPQHDKCLFCNKSFTISYSPINSRWSSFHSYVPTHYITNRNDWYSYLPTFQANIYGENYADCFGRSYFNQLWIHNKGEDSTSELAPEYNIYRNFYGCNFPYIIELVKSYGPNTMVEPYIKWVQEGYQINLNNSDPPVPLDLELVTFNKSYCYNAYQHSGNLFLNIVADPTNTTGESNFQSGLDLSIANDMPIVGANYTQIPISFREGNFSMSGFMNKRKYANYANLNTNSCTNTEYLAEFPIDQVVNNTFINYAAQWYNQDNFRDNYCVFRLILDNNNKMKVCSNFFITEPDISIN